ncbi:hypothetical protein GQ54DRAFT_306765 [Martensiomyces pterosporus]|nr:hypothetical protein GQ54DRAFT_306765 [Martensiomyces pterosporus]
MPIHRAALKSLTDYVKTSVDSAAIDKVTVATTSSLTSGDPVLTLTDIPKGAALDGSATAKKSLIQNADGSLTPVWSIVLEQDIHWWSAEVNVATGKVESLNDWYSRAESYNVYPRTVNAPSDGSRQVVVDPANTSASPKGWVSNGTTVGNNVWAQNNPTGGTGWQNNYRPKAAAGNVFNFPVDFTKQPSTYVDAAITQLFYTVNTLHDLSFIYGFDEAAGNFQDVNYSGKGLGGDGVIANAQDGSGTNNANFATPPDGQRPKMRMYVWTQTNPNRDGDFEQDIVAHEFTHGISNRLTGGPANTNCLNTLEAGGMGEGWSDTVANIIRIKSGDTRSRNILLGEYSYGKGIRNYPYSTSTSTNPSTYAYLNKSAYQEVHAVGEVWAEILYEVIWNVIDAHGIGADLFSHDLTKGNALALQLIIDGLKLQPCNPTFITARNAIIQADQNLTGGANKCAIWKGFAKRGLGPNASGTSGSTNHKEDNSVPSGC